MVKRRIAQLGIVAAIVAIAALGFGRWQRSARAARASDERVETVVRRDIPLAVRETGVLEPTRKVELKSKISGQVARVLVDVGDHVKEGDPLVELDPLDADRKVAASDAKLRVTAALVEGAARQFALRKEGHDRHVVSDVDFESARAELRRLEAQLAVDRVDAQTMRDHRNYTRLRSPITGVILARNVQKGEMVSPGTAALVDGKPLLVVAQTEELLVRVELNQIDVSRLRGDETAEVRVDGLGPTPFVGKLRRVAAMAQRSERRKDSNLLVFPVDVALDATAESARPLRPGMIAEVTIRLHGAEKALTVPLEAVVRKDGQPRLRIAESAPAPGAPADALVDVELGVQNDEVVEIVSGAREGDRVIISAKDGSKESG